MFEIGAVVRARGQHHDRRLARVVRSHCAQILQQHVGVMVNWRHRHAAEQVRKQAHHHLAVFEHVGHAGGCAQVVFEHVKLAVVGLDDVNAGNMHIDVARYLHALHFGPVCRVAGDLRRGNDTSLDDFLIVVDVFQEGIQRAHTLAGAVVDDFPSGRPDDPRNDVERDGALGAGFVTVHRKSDALTGVERVGLALFLRQKIRGFFGQPFGVGAIMRAYRAVGRAHLIVRSRRIHLLFVWLKLVGYVGARCNLIATAVPVNEF